MIPDTAREIAARCRHYAMCKIDFLQTGVCPSGEANRYVSYYPQGRMDLYDAMVRDLVPVSEGLVDIASSCTLCGICDRQCHFVTGMRPSIVMRALKERLEAHARGGGRVEPVPTDPLVESLRDIVGVRWASNDPAVLLTYANDPFPLAGMRMPRCVVLPGTRDEIVAIVREANRLGVPYVVRGNGGSVFGFVFTDGVVMDLTRMKGMEIDPESWVAAVEPGVTSFELQREAARLGLRVNAAEPAATVCGNIVCTGMFSTWSNAYGVGADNFVDMEFVDPEGRLFRLAEKTAPNAFAFRKDGSPAPGICTKAYVRLHPATEDEEGLLVPFHSFDEALSFARDLSRRRIGLAIGVLGGHYLSTFMSPTAELAEKVKANLTGPLGIGYVVSVVGDRYARDAIRTMTPTVIDQDLFRTLLLGLPRLAERGWIDLIERLEGDEQPYETLLAADMRPLLEAVLAPSPAALAEAVDDDLRDFYETLYERPEMSDLVWLTSFRILSSRMSRHKHMFAFLLYVPIESADLIREIIGGFAGIADRHSISHDYGFLTPLDFGKRAILEYDYYIDHADPSEAQKIRSAMVEIEPMLDGLSAGVKGVVWLKYVFSQGCSRKEAFLYT
jgi:hypothetical protein